MPEKFSSDIIIKLPKYSNTSVHSSTLVREVIIIKLVLVKPFSDSGIIIPPLGLGYLSSFCMASGVDTRIVDGSLLKMQARRLVPLILSHHPDVVGISSFSSTHQETLELCRGLKQAGVRIVVGGVHATALPRETLLETGADALICGEGERALAGLCQNGLIPDGIPGVYTPQNLPPGGEGPFQRALPVENLDDLPFPDWEKMPPACYPRAPHGMISKRHPIGAMITSRGCPHKCSFCAGKTLYGGRIRFRSPENVMEEIHLLVKYFGVREIHFEDENITHSRAHVEKLCHLLMESRLNLPWTCPSGVRADHVDRDLLRLMKRSGCHSLSFGIESANRTILKNMRKGENIEVIREAINLAREEGIQTMGFFIFGLPGETLETLEETARFARESNLDRAAIGVLDVLPGSELWNTLHDQLEKSGNRKSFREPIWIPDGLTRNDLLKAKLEAYWRFYFTRGRWLKLIWTIGPYQIPLLIRKALWYGIFSFPCKRRNR